MFKKLCTISGFLALLLIACRENESREESKEPLPIDSSTSPLPPQSNVDTSTEANRTMPMEGNARTSLDWDGSYKGMVPCADCEGIETLLTIRKDNTYEMEQTYRGKGDGKPFVSKGNWNWLSDNVIKLLEPSGSPTMVMVSEGKLLLLDKSGNRITGNLAEKYFLYKLQ